jgi:hypothetical protein
LIYKGLNILHFSWFFWVLQVFVCKFVCKYFDMKFNVRFAPERRKDKSGAVIEKTVPLFADIRFSGTRLFYYTGFRVDVKKFGNNNPQEADKNTFGYEGGRIVQYNIINNRIRAIRASLELFFQGRDAATKEELVTLLDSICKRRLQLRMIPQGPCLGSYCF